MPRLSLPAVTLVATLASGCVTSTYANTRFYQALTSSETGCDPDQTKIESLEHPSYTLDSWTAVCSGQTYRCTRSLVTDEKVKCAKAMK